MRRLPDQPAECCASEGGPTMRRRTLLAASTVAAASAGPAAMAPAHGGAAGPMGPLVPARGGRYFARPDGTALYLAGVHTWTNLQDANAADPPARFDFGAYLDFIAAQGHNLIRMWAWDSARVGQESGLIHVEPMPYLRTGP